MLCPLVPIYADDEKDEWVEFTFPEQMDPDSPMNIGKLVLDAPAGKHGFVTVKDGHFYFEDGIRARFWGTNLVFGANFPSKKEAEIMADRLAFFGFNAVRLHHMDFYFEPRGIFEDIAPAYKDPQLKETGHLSKKQLDKLDYLIYQLKQRGIYVDLNLLVSRHFTESDGVIDAEKLGMAAKPVSMFDPHLIKLQKKYAKDLLTHYNPYTELRYNEDPVIALIEITNENSIFQLKYKSIPTYYQNQLDQRWKNWKEGKPNILGKLSKKAFYIDIEKKYFKKMTDFLKKDCGIKIPITGIGGFIESENIETQSEMDFIDTHAYWDHPQFPNKPWDKNDFNIHNKSIIADKNLGIVGTFAKLYTTAKAQFNKPFTITEWNHCYPNQYAYETPMLIAAKAVKYDWDALFQYSYSHGWKIKPKYNEIQGYFDTIGNAQQLTADSLASLLFLKGKNLTITPNNQTITSSVLSVQFGSDSVVITLYPSNQEIILSTIKNKNSYWKNNGKFDWGNEPTLMRKVVGQE